MSRKSQNYIEVIGNDWAGRQIAMRYTLNQWQLDIIQDSMIDSFPEEAIQDWLDGNSGDFMQIDDFTATLDKFDMFISWHDEDSKWLYFDMMYPELEF